jgi:hypothetical protein
MGTPDCPYSSISSIVTSTDQKEHELAAAMSLKGCREKAMAVQEALVGPVVTTW